MKLQATLKGHGLASIRPLAKRICKRIGLSWDLARPIVYFGATFPDDLVATNTGSESDDCEQAVTRWMESIKNGFENRPSQRIGKTMDTVFDPAITKLLRAAECGLNVVEMKHHHRNAMQAENIIGHLNEEYIHERTSKISNWRIAWGNSLRATDLVRPNSHLIQIKNRDNTENSSSRPIRDGTEIKEWHRLNSKTGETHWTKLCQMMEFPDDTMSETDYREFLDETICGNPNLLDLE
jgi:hypothetical protein